MYCLKKIATNAFIEDFVWKAIPGCFRCRWLKVEGWTSNKSTEGKVRHKKPTEMSVLQGIVV